jgi:hypothetical protein
MQIQARILVSVDDHLVERPNLCASPARANGNV